MDPPDYESIFRDYVSKGDGAAFEAITEHFAGLVYGVALRRTGNRELAQETTQNVFCLLARQARTIRNPRGLPAWLHRAAYLESSNLLRKELTQRKAVKSFIESNSDAAPDHGPAEGDHFPAWQKAAPFLDEALDRLGRGDREAVLLRFFNGLPYEAIGRRTGKSGEASRKQVTRALDRLSRILKRRGVALPATAIASGLATQLGHAFPSQLTATIAQTALASTAFGAGAATTAGLLTNSAIIMHSIKTSAWIAASAVVIVFAVSTTTGFLAGRARALARQDSSQPQDESAIAIEPVASQALDSIAGARPADPGATMPRTAEELLAAAADVIRNANGDPGANTRAEALIRQIPHEAYARAAAFLPGLATEPKVLDAIGRFYCKEWGSFDPAEAIAFWSANFRGTRFEGDIYAAISSWSKTHPEAAFAWVRDSSANPPFSPGLYPSFLETTLESWGERDVNAAVDAFEELPFDDQRDATDAFDSIMEHSEEAEVRVLLAQRLAAIKDEKLRVDVTEEVVETWAEIDPEAAAAWVDTLTWSNPMSGVRVAAETFEGWIRNGETRPAMDWLWPHIPESERVGFVDEFVRDIWANQDRTAAESWMLENGYNPNSENSNQ